MAARVMIVIWSNSYETYIITRHVVVGQHESTSVRNTDKHDVKYRPLSQQLVHTDSTQNG